jgi:hypothetical protein
MTKPKIRVESEATAVTKDSAKSPKTRITVHDTLPAVEYKANDQSKLHHYEVVTMLREAFPFHFVSTKSPNDIDLIYSKEYGYGYAFAIAKLDKLFIEMIDGGFRYRDDVVLKALRAIIKKFQMKPKIYYDRGHGVFVWNIFF